MEAKKSMKSVLENYDFEQKMIRVKRAHHEAMAELATIRDALEIKEIQRCNILGKILCLHCHTSPCEIECICTSSDIII